MNNSYQIDLKPQTTKDIIGNSILPHNDPLNLIDSTLFGYTTTLNRKQLLMIELKNEYLLWNLVIKEDKHYTYNDAINEYNQKNESSTELYLYNKPLKGNQYYSQVEWVVR